MRASVKVKMLAAVLLIVAAAFMFSGFFATRYFQRVLEEQVISDEARKLEQTAAQLRYIQEEVTELARYIVVDRTVQRTVPEPPTDPFAAAVARNEMADALKGYIQIKGANLQGAYVVTANGRSFSSGVYLGGIDPGDPPDWYARFLEAGRRAGYTGPHQEKTQFADRPVISYVLRFKEVETGIRDAGHLVLNIDLGWIGRAAGAGADMLEGYALYGHGGEPIVEGGAVAWTFADTGAGPVSILADGSRDILLTQGAMQDGWLLSARISRARILEKLRFVPLFFCMVFLIAMAAICLVLVPMISRLLGPVRVLSRSLENVAGGDFDTPVDIRSGDEMEGLGNAFNRMRLDLKAYVDQRIRHEKTVRDMEIGRLMLQINPHFIYNTLGAIFYMAKEEGNERIADFTQAFTGLLQDTLNVRDEGIYTTLGQELRNIRNYVKLQSYQYPGRFVVMVTVDSGLEDCRVPGVLIQPLVENAIFHGVCAREQGGEIAVDAKAEGGDLVISIADNGAGMPAEQIGRLFAEPASYDGGAMRKIGMANVRSRIRYLYGGVYDIRVDSQPGQGTLVTVRIPLEV